MTCTCDDPLYADLCAKTGVEPVCTEHSGPQTIPAAAIALNDADALTARINAAGMTTN